MTVAARLGVVRVAGLVASRSVRRPRPRQAECATRASTVNRRRDYASPAPLARARRRHVAPRAGDRAGRRDDRARRGRDADRERRRHRRTGAPGSVVRQPELPRRREGRAVRRRSVPGARHAGSCDQTIWVRLTGRSPFTTVAGIVGQRSRWSPASRCSASVSHARCRGAAASCAARSAARSAASARCCSRSSSDGSASRRPRWSRGSCCPRSAARRSPALTAVMSGGAARVPAPVPAPARRGAAHRHRHRRRRHRRRAATALRAPPRHRRRRRAAPPPTAAGRRRVGAAGDAVRGRGRRRGRSAAQSYARMEAPEAVVADDEFHARRRARARTGRRRARTRRSCGPSRASVRTRSSCRSSPTASRSSRGEWRRELPVTAERAVSVDDVHAARRAAAGARSGRGRSRRSTRSTARPSASRSARSRSSRAPNCSALGTGAGGADRERDRGRAAAGRARSHRAHHLQRSRVRRSAAVDVRDDARHRRSPPSEIVTDVGSRPQTFARELIAGVASHRGDPGLVEFLTGIGRTVSEKVPRAVLRRCSPRSRRSSTDRRACCCSRRSRTCRGSSRRSNRHSTRTRAAVPRRAGRRRPLGVRPAPARAAAAASRSTRDDIAVVSGVYPDTAWRLVDAEEEADDARRSGGTRRRSTPPRRPSSSA